MPKTKVVENDPFEGVGYRKCFMHILYAEESLSGRRNYHDCGRHFRNIYSHQ